VIELCEIGAKEVLVDISDVQFIDSSGLRAILAVKAVYEERSCRFAMTHGSPQPEKVFELTHLAELLPFCKRGRASPRRAIALAAESGRREGPGARGPAPSASGGSTPKQVPLRMLAAAQARRRSR